MTYAATNYRSRRGGFVGGVILILLGVLLLAHNFRPDIPAWEWIARWWPVLLILLGVGRMIENIVARQTGQQPGRLLTGGEVFLILLILFAAGIVTFGNRHPGMINISDDIDMPWGERAVETQELPAQQVKPGAEILIQAQRGDITINGTDESEIRVVAKKSASAFNEGEARESARAIDVKLVPTPRGFEVRPETRGGNADRARTDLDVRIPKNTSVTVKTDSGDVHICDIHGSVDATDGHGSIEICNAGGDVHAAMKHGDLRILTAKGNVRLTGSGSEVEVDDVTGDASVEGEFFGPIRARNLAHGFHFVSNHTDLSVGALPGRLELDSGELSMDDASGNIQLTTRDKNVVMENITGRLRIDNKRGEVTVRLRRAPTEDISISEESGPIELALPANSNFEVDAVSRSGEITNDFDDPDLKSSDDGHGNKMLRGKRGNKGPRIELRSTWGPIRLRKSD